MFTHYAHVEITFHPTCNDMGKGLIPESSHLAFTSKRDELGK